MREKKEETIESEILCYFIEKWFKAFWKNDIKWYYNSKLWTYQKNKSSFIRNWISDISLLLNSRYIAIEVKRPSEMKFFNKPLEELNAGYVQTQIKGLSKQTIRRYLHAKEQKEFIEDIKREWGVWFFACSLEMVKEKLREENIII
mgnify:CR=1 FL=1